MFWVIVSVLLGLVALAYYVNYLLNSSDIKPIHYFNIFIHFRRKDLQRFCKEHDTLFEEAQKTHDHAKVTAHFYDVMAELIEVAYGSSFHFSPRYFPGQSNNDALKQLHQKLAQYLNLYPGKHALELGCGVGGSMRDIAYHSGAKVTGISLSKEEIDENNRLSKSMTIDSLCNAVQGNMLSLPFGPNSFDAVLGIYTLKYIPNVDPVMEQVSGVLKKGGRLLVYCLMKTEKYDSNNKTHTNLISKFEYSCGMPPLHHVVEVVESAEKKGLKLQARIDLSTNPKLAWYTVFTDNKFLMWALESNLVRAAIQVAEVLGILNKGFNKFMDIFVRGNVLCITKAGQMGIMSGSEVLVFEKQ